MYPNKNKRRNLTAATIGALLGSTSLNGIIVTNVDLGLSGGIAGNGNGTFDWDIDGQGGQEAIVDIFQDRIVDLFSRGNSFGVRALGPAGAGNLLNLGLSNYVNTGDATFGSYIYTILRDGNIRFATGFTSGENGYIGFQFRPAGTTLYGWAEVVLTEGGDTGTFEIVQWAYEDTGANIQTGAIPEPATVATGLGALALGAAGLRRWRKTKQAA
ncbi:hypothetical protein [Rubellicoccus peritrichatus]|uniref:PEP-CTERM protein-sorting domain-containing protein n=1 Tax=Rubellicoccus peritrichatus TaxID=3080537 RepID=A0AAQ3QUK2_9BACT|nr:hypothetical protein [Puniceicoccus sp. CR14]WOO39812.1 hypothetical protein RZN69_14400 [Puniceicoccus sp. CR14]